jgi:chemotaxis protein CheY-P-specific phosphatase CheC
MTGKLTDAERKAAAGLIEDGVSRSAEKLAQLSGTVWKIVSSSVREVSQSDLLAMFKDESSLQRGIHLRSKSLMPLEIVVLFPERNTSPIVEAVSKANGDYFKELPDRAQVILSEISNILGQGIIRTMINTLNLSVILTSPRTLEGPKSQVVAQVLSAFNDVTHTLLLSHVNMHSNNLDAECTMLLIIDTAVMRRMLKTAEVE